MTQQVDEPRAYPEATAPVTHQVALSDILRDPQFQIRRKVEPDAVTVRRYANAYRAGETLPPVALVRWNDALVLVDGWHRVAARRMIGEGDVEAIIEHADRLEDVRWLAAKANLRHGLALKTPEYLEVFKAYISARKHRVGKAFKSYRQIHQEIGGVVALGTVHAWMRKHYPAIARQMTNSPDDFIGKGGLDNRSCGPEDLIYWDATHALRTITHAVQILSNESHRLSLVIALEQALADLKSKPYNKDF